jgi:hypothetical protein
MRTQPGFRVISCGFVDRVFWTWTIYEFTRNHAKEKSRDYLRAHESVALAYADLKRRLAVDHRLDNIGYMRGKDDFVKSALADARWYETRL